MPKQKIYLMFNILHICTHYDSLLSIMPHHSRDSDADCLISLHLLPCPLRHYSQRRLKCVHWFRFWHDSIHPCIEKNLFGIFKNIGSVPCYDRGGKMRTIKTIQQCSILRETFTHPTIQTSCFTSSCNVSNSLIFLATSSPS